MRKLFVLFALLLALAGTFTPAYAAPVVAPAGIATAFVHYTATAGVSRPAPTMNQRETVTGRLLNAGKPVAGATMLATWHYRTTTSTCTGVTGSTGVASCTRSISHATPGYPVRVNVRFTKAGTLLASTATSFTPR